VREKRLEPERLAQCNVVGSIALYEEDNESHSKVVSARRSSLRGRKCPQTPAWAKEGWEGRLTSLPSLLALRPPSDGPRPALDPFQPSE
jgi:hypothetical protein